MSDWAETVREVWTNKRAEALKAQENGVQSLQASPGVSLDLKDEKVRSTLPQPVLEAYDYYFDTVESADWGSVSVSKEAIQNQDVFAVTVSTDGDDGWAELFDAKGQKLGAARTLSQWVNWGETDAIRAYTENSALPTELQAHQETEANQNV